MAIAVDTAITNYQANTSDHEAALKRLIAIQKDLGKAVGEFGNTGDDSLKKQLESWKGLAKTVAATAGAIALAREGFKAYAEETRLATASAGANIDKLSVAAGGLVEHIDLLKFAAQAQHGAFKLSQGQMEDTETAILALTRAGFDNSEVTKKVTDAVIGLKDDGLKDLGIRIRGTTSDADKFKAIMEALAAKANGVDTASANGAESVERMGTTFRDALQETKVAIGGVVAAFGPLLEAVAQLAKGVAWLVSKIADGWAAIGHMAFDGPDWLQAMTKEGQDKLRAQAGYAKSGDSMENWLAMGRDAVDMVNVQDYESIAKGKVSFDAFGAITSTLAKGQYVLSGALDVAGGKLEKWKTNVDAAREAAKAWKIQLDEILTKESDERRNEGYANIVKRDQAQHTSLDAVISGYAGYRNDITENQGDSLGQRLDQLTDQQTASKRYFQYQEGGFLTRTFGKVGEFDVYSSAFKSLGDAIGGTYEAMVTGSEPAEKAFKKLIANSVLATGKQMTIEAVKEGAWALGDLAIGNFPGAAAHGLAAAEFAAGAALAGIVASELGAGGGSSTGGGKGGGGAPSGSSNPPPAVPSSNIIVVGDDFADDSPRQRQLRARRLFGMATGRNSVVTDE